RSTDLPWIVFCTPSEDLLRRGGSSPLFIVGLRGLLHPSPS
ncbi:hypothetical protein HMPREF1556_01324, partial [Porphyromonas sp. oral taxon 278 str. W7784]